MVTYRVPGFEYTSIHDAFFNQARDSGFDMELFRLIENIVVYEVEASSVFPALNIPQICCRAEYVLWQQVFPNENAFPGSIEILDGITFREIGLAIRTAADRIWARLRRLEFGVYRGFTIRGMMLKEENGGTASMDHPTVVLEESNHQTIEKQKRVEKELFFLGLDAAPKLKSCRRMIEASIEHKCYADNASRLRIIARLGNKMIGSVWRDGEIERGCGEERDTTLSINRKNEAEDGSRDEQREVASKSTEMEDINQITIWSVIWSWFPFLIYRWASIGPLGSLSDFQGLLLLFFTHDEELTQYLGMKEQARIVVNGVNRMRLTR